MDSGLQAAIYKGFLDPPSNPSSSVPVACSTGNCTFPQDNSTSYQSLGLCSSCIDITNRTQPFNVSFGSKGNQWNSSLPNGLTIGSFPPNNDGPTVLNMTHWDPCEDLGEPEFSACITGFKAIMMVNREPGLDASKNVPFAVSCDVSLCINTYSAAEVSNFVLQEEVQESVPVPIMNGDVDDALVATGWDSFSRGKVTNRTMRNGTWQDCNATATETEMNSVWAITSQHNLMKWYPADCLWGISEDIETQLLLLDDFFDGSLTLAMDKTYRWSETPSYMNATMGSLWTQNLYKNGTADLSTVTKYMDDLMSSMNAVIRQKNPNTSTSSVYGTAYSTETCIRVQWAWLTLPASLLVLTIFFLVATAVHSRCWHKTWKSSSLALIFHGFRDSTRDKHGILTRTDEMEKAAEHIRAQLGDWEHGWRFVERN